MIVSISSAKGKFQGTVEQAAAWLAEMQPAHPSIDTDDGNAEIVVDGTPGASMYRRAIEAALAGVSIAELDAIEAEEGARRAYYAAYDRGARAAQKALSAE